MQDASNLGERCEELEARIKNLEKTILGRLACCSFVIAVFLLVLMLQHSKELDHMVFLGLLMLAGFLLNMSVKLTLDWLEAKGIRKVLGLRIRREH